jgi:RNA polymerase sigma-70 factor (ECF subfamily)
MGYNESDGGQPPSSSAGLDVAGIYSDLKQSLGRYVRRYLKNTPHDAEDVVQEAFIRVIETQRGGHIHSPRAFLYTTARNLALNAIDKSAYKLTDTLAGLLPAAVISEALSAEDQFESWERSEQFCRAIHELPPKRRRVFVLRRVYGLSQKEIATRMNISLKTVEAHMAISIAQVMDYMEALEASASDGGAKRRDASMKG